MDFSYAFSFCIPAGSPRICREPQEELKQQEGQIGAHRWQKPTPDRAERQRGGSRPAGVTE